jgi:hypothetical protein
VISGEKAYPQDEPCHPCDESIPLWAESSHFQPHLDSKVAHGMRRPDKTELEFFVMMVLVGVPFAYVVIRTVLAFVGM